jgi:hypothetical protein
MFSRVLRAGFLGVIGVVACAVVSGCAGKSKPDATVAVPAGRYPEAFEAAKDALREFQFELDRVDAAGGIVTTHARGSAGFATPWVPHTSGLEDAGRGFVERERRRAAVVFEAVGAGGTEGSEPSALLSSGKEPAVARVGVGDDALPIDLALEPLDTSGEVRARVRVWVERVYRPGRRVSSTSVRLSSFTSDPELREEGLEPAFAVTTREDEALGGRVAREIVLRMGPPR